MHRSGSDTLERIYEDIANDTQDVMRLLASQATQLVRGSGSESASIMFIGEAPGKNEDKTGVPFCGASGKLLDELLNSIECPRSEVFITNIVKYRPPNNRDPSAPEKQAFLAYLQREIAVVKPTIIAPLGRHSMSAFLPDAVISEVHGTVHTTSYGDVMPLYHPAAAIYNRSLRQTLFDDVTQLIKYI